MRPSLRACLEELEERVTKCLETYRGVVNPWECDVVQHFTIAYYFDRFADATRNFFDLAGEGDDIDARARVKPWEIDEDGTMSLPAHIHRFSAAAMHILAAVGMTTAYMHEKRRGFSTFELDLTRVGAANVGDIIDVTTSVAHLGNSSLRLVHRMTGPTGREIAFLVQSGVHLDMDARRSTAIPDELRASMQALLIRDS